MSPKLKIFVGYLVLQDGVSFFYWVGVWQLYIVKKFNLLWIGYCRFFSRW